MSVLLTTLAAVLASDPKAAVLPRAHAAHQTASPVHWRRAKPVVWNTDYAGRPTRHLTSARFIWHKGALHVRFELHEAELAFDESADPAVERPALYKEDCVELFIDPTPESPETYFEIEAGPGGHFFDLALEDGVADIAWSGRLQVASRIWRRQRRVRIDLVIRAEEVVGKLAPRSEWRIGIFRMEGKSPRQYLAWSPPRTPRPNFHLPSAFGVLVLDP